MKLVCQNCSKEFKTYNRQAKYCSKECYYKGRWGAEGRLISKVCPVCQKRFSSHLSNNQKYCSTDCSDKSGHTRGRRNTITKSCDWCGKEFSRPASNFHSKHFFCSPECSALWWAEFGLHGKDHPKWRGGRYPKILQAYSDGWHPARREALIRDNYTCQRCGTLGVRLEVHHIKPLRYSVSAEEANNLDNLIVLCAICHHQIEYNSLSEEYCEMQRQRLEKATRQKQHSLFP